MRSVRVTVITSALPLALVTLALAGTQPASAAQHSPATSLSKEAAANPAGGDGGGLLDPLMGLLGGV
ncbi:hypothetical protein [Streptomyces sp. NPDC059008]|uniref:hypothetical protein n=1 Tax=Streptomyces sp. NPDC059008 TaxID=3346693 RepID=UPI0036CE94D3